jgi:transcriptional regulator with XRE-family HTH domain
MIGQLLKENRTKLNLTQKQLAQKSGISYVSINRIENGKNPRLSVVSKLFEAMGQTLQITSQENVLESAGSNSL